MCKKILLIDDDEDEQFFFTEALKEIKVQVQFFFAPGAKQGISMFDFIVPNIVFIDINMPSMNGLECLESIMNNKNFNKCSAIIYSTGVDDFIYEPASLKGVAACIKKQQSIHELATILKQLL